jgi:hypothetical protein
MTEIEGSRPWERLIQQWPTPSTFDLADPRFTRLAMEMNAWVRSQGARTLFYRTHSFRYASYLPDASPANDREREIENAAHVLNEQNMNGWSHRIRNSRELTNEILWCIAQGLVDSRIFLEPALLILPHDTSVYRWDSDVRPGATPLSTQLSQLDQAELWRAYYVDAPLRHPIHLYNGMGRPTVLFPGYPNSSDGTVP